MNRLYPKLSKRESGQGLVETALALPFVFLIIFGITELFLYLYTNNVVSYAAFMAARSAVVHEEKTLGSIGYSRGDTSKRIIQATAEKIIIESLPWEHERIDILSEENPLERAYYNESDWDTAAIKVRLRNKNNRKEVEIIYCLPIHFGLAKYFIPTDYTGSCANVTKPSKGGTYTGIEIKHVVRVLKNI